MLSEFGLDIHILECRTSLLDDPLVIHDSNSHILTHGAGVVVEDGAHLGVDVSARDVNGPSLPVHSVWVGARDDCGGEK